jgi:predicted nucleic-acid-binding protein
MQELIIDTNLLLSFVTDRNLAQQEKAAQLFLSASRLKLTLWCPQAVITEFVYVLEKIYSRPKEQIRQMLIDLIALPGVQVAHELDVARVLTYWPEHITDFGDALVGAVAKGRAKARVATFDKRLRAALERVGLQTVLL